MKEHQPTRIEHKHQRLMTIGQILVSDGYEWATHSYLRSLVYNAADRFGSGGTKIAGNGFAQAVIRIGGKVLIDMNEFDAFIERHRMAELSSGTQTPCNTKHVSRG